MSVTLQQRLKRLADSGLRGSCKPAELVSQLEKQVRLLDDQMIRRLEQVCFGLADKTRLKILKLLAKEELCVCEIMAALRLTQPTSSHHLGILERSGLVETRREGKWVFYRLASPKVDSLLALASRLAQGGL